MYKKFPVLYNTSLVSSFEPKVIYKVRRSLNGRKQTAFRVRSENSHRPVVCLRTQMRQTDPQVVTALVHRPWRLSRLSDGTPRSLSTWAQMWTGVLDVLLDWAHHHILWKLCGVSAIFVQKDFISLWVEQTKKKNRT